MRLKTDSPSRFRVRQMLPLAVCWALSFYLLFSFATSDNYTPPHTLHPAPSINIPPQNELCDVAMTCLNPQNKSTPDYSIQFQKLQVDNGKLGLFRSALCKEMNVENLALSLYAQTENSKKTPGGPVTFNSTLAKLTESLPANLLSILNSDKKNRALAADILKAMRININDFHLSWLKDGQQQLHIESKRALLTAIEPGQLTLRGAVSIRTPETRVQSNHIVWDVTTGLFTVKGSYVLTHQENKQYGRDICLDSRLTIQKKQSLKLNKREKHNALQKMGTNDNVDINPDHKPFRGHRSGL